ncbi:organic cation transporter protein-like [Scaptodrosophila lebanonensis]|uniref:Organic cation transporter protein-like n=1 Tax=Drosophila lebanonensis TaxID=7225 RepID=A0A6J2TCU0_DROLE|nr:organic cation transporter protein-like [Scaptodrosophila lebanonensis]
MDFEQVMDKCGSFGRYQILLLILFSCSNILSSLHYFAQTIISFTPKHSCVQPEIASNGLQIFHNNTLSRCSFIELNENTGELNMAAKCQAWEYERESGYESVTTELNWVCDDAYKLAVGQSFFFLGSVVGTISVGYVADRFGRLPACVLTTLMGATGDFITSFVNNLQLFSLGRFISGFSTDTVYMLMFILVFEYLSPKRRTFGLNIVSAVFYTLTLMISPWLAIWVGTWRHYLWVASLPALVVLAYPCLVFESAEWLLTKQRYDKAANCLRRIAKINRRQVDESVFEEFKDFYRNKTMEQAKFNTQKDTFMDMFRTPRMRKFTIILLIKSIIITVAFDIISRNMEGIGTSPFKLFSYTGIAHLPSGLTIILFQNYIGRKGMACASLFFGGIITAVTGYLLATLDPAENAILMAFMVGLARYGATVAYDAEAQYAAEIIPTSVRGRGVANIHVIGYGFGFCSSYIIYLGTFYKPLPALFISVLMLIGAALCLTLPETQNKKLPQTVADGEIFGIGEKWFFFSCFSRRRRQKEEQFPTAAVSTIIISSASKSGNNELNKFNTFTF